MKKIRIMHIAQAGGGVDRYLRCFFKYIDHNQYENIFICSEEYEVDKYKTKVDYIEKVKMQRAIGFNDIKSIINIRKLIKKYSPDIIYAHSSKAGALMRIANIGINNICFYNPHGWAFNMKVSKCKRFLYKEIEKVLARFTDKIICISDAEKNSAVENKICTIDKLQVIYNGIDILKYKTEENKMANEIPKGSFVVGMVGRLSKQKSPDIFIEMASLIQKDIPSAFFVLVGDGEDREKIEKMAVKNKLNFLITGWIEQPLTYIRTFDVAVLLSRWEGFGLVIPEYMICRKPVVATNVDAIPNIITDHNNGLLVPSDDPEAAYKGVMELYRDIELKNNIIDQGFRDVCEKYDIRRAVHEHEKNFIYIMHSKIEKEKT